MKTSNQFVRKTDFKIVQANARMVRLADRFANLETDEVVRERSRKRKHRVNPRVATHIELAKRARMVRAGMWDALAMREELVPLDGFA
jgi:hypothetical protein